MKTTLSIITVAYFDTERLVKTIESIDYTVQDFEHIFVVPEQDEISVEVVRKLQSRLPGVLLVHDQGVGVYNAMNLGAANSSGDYLVFWNAGEQLVNAGSLSRLISSAKFMETNVIVTAWIDSNGTHIPNSQLTRDFLRMSTTGFISHQAVLIRKNFFRELKGFDPRYRVAADTKMIRCALRGKMAKYFIEPVVIVEPAMYSSVYNRRGRFEFFLILFRSTFKSSSAFALLNFLKSEFLFLCRKWFKKPEIH